MLHKTLESYHNDDPWKEDQNHPDGCLWLIKPKEFGSLPNGTRIENIDGLMMDKMATCHGGNLTKFEREHGYMSWGLRGHKDD
jgi:hypothetical protein